MEDDFLLPTRGFQVSLPGWSAERVSRCFSALGDPDVHLVVMVQVVFLSTTLAVALETNNQNPENHACAELRCLIWCGSAANTLTERNCI